MKKLVSCALVLTMILSLAGCSKGSTGFSGTVKKVTKAAENVYGAEEATKKQKKKIMDDDDFDYGDSDFQDGVYVTLDEEDIEDIDFGEDVDFDPEEIRNFFLFIKSERSRPCTMTEIYEMSDKAAVDDLFEYMLDRYGTTEKKLKKLARNQGAEYGFEEDDNMLAAILYSEEKNALQSCYIKKDGKVVIVSQYTGKYDSDVCEEFFDYAREAGFYDTETLIEEEEDD